MSEIKGAAPNMIIVDSIPEEATMEYEAAKQLLAELLMIKRRIYDSKTLVSSVLIVQIKQVLRGLIRKYNDAGLLVGENITLVLSDKTKYANIRFGYSQHLQFLISLVETNMKAEIEASTRALIDEQNKKEEA